MAKPVKSQQSHRQRAIRFVIVSDSHGDLIDQDTEWELNHFLADFKPAIRIHAGDVFDFRWLRRKASEQEQREAIHPDIVAGIEFLKRYKPQYVVWGNHDQRVFDGMLSDKGPMSALCTAILERIDAAMRGAVALPYDKRSVLALADLRITHGIYGGKEALKQTMDTTAGDGTTVIMGHLHRLEYRRRINTGGGGGFICPCLCQLDLPYNSVTPSALAQATGWLFGEIRDGRAYVQSRIVKESRSCPVVVPLSNR